MPAWIELPIPTPPPWSTLAVPEPADARRKALERDPTRSEGQPADQRRVVREELEEHPVDGGDVARIARECGPPERPDTAAEQRPNIGRDKARVCERFL